jgi:hypothetical protein
MFHNAMKGTVIRRRISILNGHYTAIYNIQTDLITAPEIRTVSFDLSNHKEEYYEVSQARIESF